MKRFLLISAAVVLFAFVAKAQRCFELPVWGEQECQDDDYRDAVLFCSLPEECNGKAILACPGGAYMYLAIDHEGKGFAPIFNEQGIALFTLKYRLPKGRCSVPLADAEKAMRIIRAHSKEWGIKEVGIMGSSAGGHLASTLATHYADSICRPDFQILLYPVVTMQEKYTHKGSRDALLGNNPSYSLVEKFSNELHVNSKTPRAFIVLPSADKTVYTQNSLQYAQALVNNGVSVDLHMYEGGYHGFGNNSGYTEYNQWINELLYWVRK